jgi:hypothetical protein
MSDPLKPLLNISNTVIQKYLRDVVVSTIARKDPTFEMIRELDGDQTFVFKSPWQFFTPYAACLLATIIIYIFGIRDLHLNGVSAGNSFLQWVTTTRVSENLNDLAQRCSPGGRENISDHLNNLELLFGVKRGGGEIDDEQSTALAGFGCVTEVEPCP